MGAYITKINTAVPSFKIPQREAAATLGELLEMDDTEKRKLDILFRATGIHSRYSVVSDYLKQEPERSLFKTGNFPDTNTRMQKYIEALPKLAFQAASPVVNSNDPPTHIIVVSCTGVYAPGLDIDMVEGLKLPRNTYRLGITFMGCYAAITAIRQAKSIIEADQEAKVLIISIELCSLHTQLSTREDDLLASALFGDGAAAIEMRAQPLEEEKVQFKVIADYSEFFPAGKRDMAWTVGNSGFEMRLSNYVPDIIRDGIGKLSHQLLSKAGLKQEDIDHFIIHPGGKKIIETIEKTLNIQREKNQYAWNVLQQYGNMSSPTFLFVLNDLKKVAGQKHHNQLALGMAFGPGLTLESNLLQIYSPNE